MMLIYTAIIGCLIVYFFQTIYIVLTAYSSNAIKSKNTLIGNIWFISLLIINITIIIFIIMFYYNKSTQPGRSGLDGNKGYPGESGTPCSMKNEYCYN